jgi:hypothetical protein
VKSRVRPQPADGCGRLNRLRQRRQKLSIQGFYAFASGEIHTSLRERGQIVIVDAIRFPDHRIE